MSRPSTGFVWAIINMIRLMLTWNAWRGDPATAKQMRYANSLGIKYPANISKGDLSSLISARLNRQ